MNHLDIFSGIGGFSLAAQRVWGKEHNIVAFCENDKYCQKVLKKHWPDVPIIEKIEDLTYERILAYTNRKLWSKRGENTAIQQPRYGKGIQRKNVSSTKKTETQTKTIDLLTGGWPCQPFSVAGKRKGREDDRYLWHEMFRIIQETKPTWIIGENVTGIINMELDNVLSDLESEGYETQTFIIPACAVDARHRRDRIWIVAYSKNPNDSTSKDSRKGTQIQFRGSSGRNDVANTTIPRQQGQRMPFNTSNQEKNGKGQATTTINGSIRAIWPVEPNVGRVAHGIPSRVDRLKALGNAIVVPLVEVIMRGIKEIEANQ